MEHLIQVQRRRELPTRFIQAFQSLMQKQVIQRSLRQTAGPLPVPFIARLALHIPLVRDLLARIIGFGRTQVKLIG